jgi:pullulanase
MPLARLPRVALALLAAALVCCLAPAAVAAPPEPVSIEDRLTPPRDAGLIVVHYHRPDGDYRGWNIWTWIPDGDGRADDLTGRTAFGRYATIRVPRNANRRGVIVRKNEWEAKDIDHDRFIDLDDDHITEVWLVSGDPKVYTDPADIDLSVDVVGAFIDDNDAVLVTFTRPPDADQLDGVRVLVDGQPGVYTVTSATRVQRNVTRGVPYKVSFSPDVADHHLDNLSIHVPDLDPITAYARDVLTEDRFTALDADLGSRWSDASTTFRVWSPVSERVDVLLYDRARDATPAREVPMTMTGNGVWEAQVAGDLHGTAYQYRYFSYGKERVAADINCFAATADSSRSVVVDLERTNPDNWGSVDPPTLPASTDEIIYEIHVRDFSIADPSLESELRGTYLGLIHDGEITVGDRTITTGAAHLDELGVTAVHLLPIHDFTAPLDQYNWGYWTALFNVAESNYSTNPNDPTQAITDLKTAIAGLHERDIRVILDVVYNHTSSSYEWSPFYQSAPYYWFRTTPDGQLRNDAGVGNSIADERPMVRKYVADSLAFWVEHYRVDGFRFDLIGTHHPDSVEHWTERVRSIRPDLTIYGEPWTGGGPVYFPKGAQRGMGLAVFNDNYRNAIRGDLDGDATGFATGPGGDPTAIRQGVRGAITDFTNDPTETINYVSAHDNLTFWDKLLRVAPAGDDDRRKAMHTLAHGMVLTSQGVAFVHGAADFARTKGGNHNSYNAGDEVNKFDWPRKAQYHDVFVYIRDLIRLRNDHPAFRIAEADDVRDHVRMLPTSAANSELVVAFTIDGAAVGDEWDTVLVAYNGAASRQLLRLPAGEWTVAVDADRVAAPGESLDTERGGVIMPPYSMLVLHQ